MKFVFDLDGTLCFDGMTIAEEIKTVLEQTSHEIIFASARSYRDCIGVLGEVLSQNLVIGLNGGLAYKEGQLLFHRHLDEQGYHEALSFCKQYALPYFVDDDFNYSSSQMEKIPFAKHVDPLVLGKRLDLSELKNPIKMVISLDRHEDALEDLRHHLSVHDTLDISYHEDEKCFYINPYQTNKATTTTELIGTDFVVFGNDQNDKELFKASLYSCQVGSCKALSAYADEQILADPTAVADKIKDLFEKFEEA